MKTAFIFLLFLPNLVLAQVKFVAQVVNGINNIRLPYSTIIIAGRSYPTDDKGFLVCNLNQFKEKDLIVVKIYKKGFREFSETIPLRNNFDSSPSILKLLPYKASGNNVRKYYFDRGYRYSSKVDSLEILYIRELIPGSNDSLKIRFEIALRNNSNNEKIIQSLSLSGSNQDPEIHKPCYSCFESRSISKPRKDSTINFSVNLSLKTAQLTDKNIALIARTEIEKDSSWSTIGKGTITNYIGEYSVGDSGKISQNRNSFLSNNFERVSFDLQNIDSYYLTLPISAILMPKMTSKIVLTFQKEISLKKEKFSAKFSAKNSDVYYNDNYRGLRDREEHSISIKVHPNDHIYEKISDIFSSFLTIIF